MYFRHLLAEAGVEVREHARVDDVECESDGFVVSTPRDTLRARRVLLAAGGWTPALAAKLGYRPPVRVRVNTVSVTERVPHGGVCRWSLDAAQSPPPRRSARLGRRNGRGAAM
jgi:glycine/D-amino acid oxidase-like deaminating enzyme